MASTNLSRTLGSGSATNKFTYSTWLKYSGWVAGGQRFFSTVGTGDTYFRFNEDGTMEVSGHNSGAGSAGYFITNRVFNDRASWYHIVIRFDSTESSASNRLRLYINGVQEESFSTYTDVNQNSTDNINLSGNTQIIGGTSSSQYFNGLMAQTILSIGYSYAPTTFGEVNTTSGEWKPKADPSLSYGTNGFKLTFEDTSNLGDDTSGNTNDFTLSGSGTPTLDCASNNFATLNPIANGGANLTITNGNTTVYDSDSTWRSGFGGFAPSSGKWYFEVKRVGASSNVWIGIMDSSQLDGTGAYKFIAKSRGYGYSAGGEKGNSGSESAWGNAYAQNDIVGCAMDLDNGKIYFSKNGVWENSGNPESGATGTGSMYDLASGYNYFPATSLYSTTAGVSFNFGNGYFGTTAVTSAGTGASTPGTFEYDVPTGYQPLTTKGLNV